MADPSLPAARPAPMLFDLDGTLVDSLADIRASTNHVRLAVGLPELDAAAVRAIVGDGARTLLERALAGADGVTVDDVWPLYEAHHEHQCTRLVAPYPGVVERLGRLAAAGTPMAVVTNKPARFARRILDHLGLSAWLPVVIGGDTTPYRKPSPEPLLEALRRLGVAAPRGTMVGDGVQDLRAGKAAGLRTVAVLFGFRDEATLRAEGADEYWRAF